MKRLSLYAILLLGLCSFSACNSELPDELFDKYVLLTQNGVVDYNIEFNDLGTYQINLPVSVNGTSKNSQDVTVSLAQDPDTLSKYNFERYRNRTALYYQLATEKMYSFPNGSSTTIKCDSDYSVIPLQLNLKNFDFYQNYILALKIESASPLPIASNKYSKLLMRLNISNFFSGSYSVNGWASEFNNQGQKMTITAASLHALGSNTCYLYCGNVTESDEDRAGYTMTVTVDKSRYLDSEDNATGAKVRTYKAVTIGSRNADKTVTDISSGNSYISVSVNDDPINKNIQNIITKIYLNYTYMNLRDSEYPTKMIFNGTFTRSVSIDKITGKKI